MNAWKALTDGDVNVPLSSFLLQGVVDKTCMWWYEVKSNILKMSVLEQLKV